MSEKKKIFTVKSVFIWVILTSILVRIAYFFVYNKVEWDASVYLGMGKYIFSGGAIGTWESFRPVLWPIIMGFFWRVGLDPLVTGKIIVFLCSVGCIYLTYLIGKRIHLGVGLLAAAMLSFTPIFFTSTFLQITDIPALFVSLLAIYLVLQKKHFLGGLSAGAAFSLRFPHALTYFIVIITLLWLFFNHRQQNPSLRPALYFSLGTAVLVIPYLISNYILYGSLLAPIIEGQQVVQWTIIAGRSYWYYFIELIKTNPLLLFLPIGILFYMFNDDDHKESFIFVLFAFLVLTAYYMREPHKEIRYALAFLPYYCLLASYGIYEMYHKSLSKLNRHVSFELMTFLLVSIVTICLMSVSLTSDKLIPAENAQEFDEYLMYFSNLTGERVFGTNAQVVSYSDVRFIRYSYWPSTQQEYNQAQPIDYVTINTCAVYCKKESDPACPDKRDAFLSNIGVNQLVFNKTTNGCKLLIYKTK